MDISKRIEELEKKNAELELRLNKLINCLYPNVIGQQDVDYIDRKSEGE